MGQRRVLVIGSQCEALPHLEFLPELAKQLYEVLVNPKIGMCVSALDDRSGILIDCEASETKDAIKSAFTEASKQSDTLIIALIGHGVSVEDDDFYYMTKDSAALPDSESAVQLSQQIKESYRYNSFIDGLILLVDTCHSGVAAMATAEALTRQVKFPTRFEVLTATGKEVAYDGCFTRILINTLRDGLPEQSSDKLLCYHLSQVVDQDQACGKKQESDHISRKTDEGLFLANNVALLAKQNPWVRTEMWSEIERHTQWFQPTPNLNIIVEESDKQRCLALIGQPGSGKSALMASLARPKVTGGIVPDGFLQAIIFLSEAIDTTTLANELSHQLQTSVENFSEALETFDSSIPLEELNKMDLMQRKVLGPLRHLPPTQIIRIAVDALDQLSESASLGLYRALNSLTKGTNFPHIRLVVSSRPNNELPVGAKKRLLNLAGENEITAYLDRRDVPSSYLKSIVDRAEGSWLIVQLLADFAIEGTLKPNELPGNLIEVYDQVLLNIGARQRNSFWRKQLRPILSILAVSGAGPILPITLLCDASQRLGGPSKLSQIRDLLVDLRGFVDRRSPGTENEADGLFHTTFGEYLRDTENGIFSAEVQEAQAALVDSIAALAPMEQHDSHNQLHQYATEIEAQLLWTLGKQDEALESHNQRKSTIPRENLIHWSNWNHFIQGQLPPDHPDTLRTRGNIAFYTGESGDVGQALVLFQQLLPDEERVLGKDHPYTLTTRGNIAFYTGKSGDVGQALVLFQQLLPDRERVLGKDHPDTLMVRKWIDYLKSDL